MKLYQPVEEYIDRLVNKTKDQLDIFDKLFKEEYLVNDLDNRGKNKFNLDEQNSEIIEKLNLMNGKQHLNQFIQVQNKLQRDKNKFNQNDLFQCDICLKQFKSAKQTLIHKKIYHKDLSDILLCQYCHKSYFGLKSLLQHQSRHHKKQIKIKKSGNQTIIQNIDQNQDVLSKEGIQQE